MKKYHWLFVIVALFITQQSFAHGKQMKECKPIVKACVDAGYGRKANTGKAFWHGCMKPLLLGKTVANITVDANTISACRQAKITKMQNELEQLQQVQSR